MRARVMTCPLVCLLLQAGCNELSDAPPNPIPDAGFSDAMSGADVGDGMTDSTVGPTDGNVEPPIDAPTDGPPDATGCVSEIEDYDGDGFSAAQGDCNDCNASINPGASEMVGNDVDEDCDGSTEAHQACDQALAESGDDPNDAARALGLCDGPTASASSVLSARWVFPDGSSTSNPTPGFPACSSQPTHPLSRGVLSRFGAFEPREGAAMVVMSSGVARPGRFEIDDASEPATGEMPLNATVCRLANAPAGFPVDLTDCGDAESSADTGVYDPIALELSLRVPSNAVALFFDFAFFSMEFPYQVCTEYNDHFVALLDSSHPATPANGNVSFDSDNNVISASTAFMRVCEPVVVGGRIHDCPAGPDDLLGTGYGLDSHVSMAAGGGTGWLTSRAPVVPGETVRLRFAIWDTADGTADSTVLIDNLRWQTETDPDVPPPDEDVPETVPVVLY